MIATVLVSWHTQLYHALLPLIPMRWMYARDSVWISQAPNVLILLSTQILLDLTRGYLVGICLCALFPVLILFGKKRATHTYPDEALPSWRGALHRLASSGQVRPRAALSLRVADIGQFAFWFRRPCLRHSGVGDTSEGSNRGRFRESGEAASRVRCEPCWNPV